MPIDGLVKDRALNKNPTREIMKSFSLFFSSRRMMPHTCSDSVLAFNSIVAQGTWETGVTGQGSSGLVPSFWVLGCWELPSTIDCVGRIERSKEDG